MVDESPQPVRTKPQRLLDSATSDHNDLAEIEDPIEEEAEHGRIGYGRFGEWTPYGLAAAIILTILVIAGINWLNDDDSSGVDDPTPTSEVVSRGPAPAFSTTLLDGSTFNLADYRGKVVVVNFWATWCDPCKKEMPALQTLSMNNPDVVVIGIAEPRDTRGKVDPYLSQYGTTYPIAIDDGGNGPVGEVGGDFQVFGYPATFFIDANGNLIDAVYGPVPIEQLQTYIDRARSTS